MNRFTRFLNSMNRRDRLGMVHAVEIHKLETASRVIRQMIQTGEYEGFMMCVVIYMSNNLTNEEKLLTTDVINNYLISGTNSLTSYIFNKKPRAGSHLLPVCMDIEFLQHAITCQDDFTRRVALSSWYLNQCRELDKRVTQLKIDLTW